MNNIIDFCFSKKYQTSMSLGFTVFKRTDNKLECISLNSDATCQALYVAAGKELVLTFGGRLILPNDEPLADLGIGSESVINVDLNMCWIDVIHGDNIKERILFSINATPKDFRPIVEKTLKKYPGKSTQLKIDNPILRQMIKSTNWEDNDLLIEGVGVCGVCGWDGVWMGCVGWCVCVGGGVWVLV